MPVQQVDVSTFLELAKHHPVFDVRSPLEFAHAHIPGAVSLPIFTDEQRAQIGTTYKQVSRQDAIKIGLTHFGPQMLTYVQTVENELKKLKQTGEQKVLVHCWRGGMRSGAMAWLLGFYGFDVVLLQGGYKSYRNYVLEQLNTKVHFRVLGGNTGSGKTEVLHELQKQGEAVLDLEALAQHKGSAFGGLGMPAQPTQEQFENNLFQVWNSLPVNQPIWVENESQRIGLLNVPGSLFKQLQEAPLYVLTVPFEERLNHIIKQYGGFAQTDLVAAILRIQKKLGGLVTKQAVQCLLDQDVAGCFRLLLQYYDKLYEESSQKQTRKPFTVSCEHVHAQEQAQLIFQQVKND
jgi:tRNA 2-selenouridine synthase